MRHAGGQPSQRGELVRLEQLQARVRQVVGHGVEGLGQHAQFIFPFHLDPLAAIAALYFPRGGEQVLDSYNFV